MEAVDISGVTSFMACRYRNFQRRFFTCLHGPLWCWIVLAASVSIGFLALSSSL